MSESQDDQGRDPSAAGPVGAGDPPPPPVAKASSGAVPPTPPPAGEASDQIEQDLDALLADAQRERDEYLELAKRTQADFENFRKRMTAEVQAAAGRGKAEVIREVVPVLDDLERAIQAAGLDPEGDSEDGLVAWSAAGLPQAAGDADAEWGRGCWIRRGRSSTRTLHEALSTVAVEWGRVGDGRRGDAEGLPAWRAADPAGPRGGERVGGSWLTISTRCSASRRRPPRRRSRRRTASWRASTTLTATPTIPAAEENFKEIRAPTTCSPTPRSARSTTPVGHVRRLRWRRPAVRAAATPSAAGGPGAASAASTSATSSPASSAAAAAAGGPRPSRCVAATSKPRSAQLRPGRQRRPGQRHRAEGRALPDLPRQRRQTGHQPGHLPALRRPRHRRPEPGLLLDQPALPAVRRRRPDHRGPLPHLRRLRPDPADQALQGQHPGRGQGRSADPPRRQGRGRASAAGPRETST